MGQEFKKTYIVTGGAGFIGSALVRRLVRDESCFVVNVDCLTYAGNLESLVDVEACQNYAFEAVDIRNAQGVNRIFERYEPDGVYHLAAESHVDRSIDDASDFLTTNILGTHVLLDAATKYFRENERRDFKFLHVSTDEVYGSLGDEGLFSEESAYRPNSPYAASKASSDHLVRAWGETYGLPIVITNCSNNYGPYQFPEKLIPLCIQKAISGEPLPVYGDGQNVRDWLYVEDHISALEKVMYNGRLGETYAIGGWGEKTNLDVVTTTCQILDEVLPRQDGEPYAQQITFVADRPGHDFRYAIDSTKLQNELGWKPAETFETGLRRTVLWYLENSTWVQHVLEGSYQGQRLGVTK